MISVIVPTRNEEKFIATTIQSLIQQKDLNESFEIIVLDGESTDSTVSEATEALGEYGVVIKNPGITVSEAARIGLQEAKGDKIMIAGAHAVYPDNLLAELSSALIEQDVGAAGGILISLPANPASSVSLAIADTLSSPLGVGFSHRFSGHKQVTYVNTVAFPLYRREVFDQLGNFNPRFIRAQDLDFHLRITESGWRIAQVPSVEIGYYVRPTFPSESKMAFDYGFWKPFVNRHHSRLTSFRQLFPVFVVAVFVLAIVTFLFHLPVVIALGMPAYAVALFVGSVHLAGRTTRWRLIVAYMLSFFILHFGYGIGYIFGIVRSIVAPIERDENEKVLK